MNFSIANHLEGYRKRLKRLNIQLSSDVCQTRLFKKKTAVWFESDTCHVTICNNELDIYRGELQLDSAFYGEKRVSTFFEKLHVSTHSNSLVLVLQRPLQDINTNGCQSRSVFFRFVKRKQTTGKTSKPETFILKKRLQHCGFPSTGMTKQHHLDTTVRD